jgi:photosystem II stability/assembly factor-like uncharacterized protein
MTVNVCVGTEKGAWVLTSDDRRVWDLSGPYAKGWKVTTFGRDLEGGYLLATGSSWYGAAIQRSSDLDSWQQLEAGPAYGEGSERTLSQIWTIRTIGDRLFAGVADAGLFTSDDNGESWAPVKGLNEHPTSHAWQPGMGGLACHRILSDGDRLWVGISAVGVFRSDDGGDTWELKNAGIPSASPNDDLDIGYCVHCLVQDPDDGDRIWRQDHMGVFRSSDGGDTWERIEEGLPARFGFPIDRDHRTGRLFVFPQESDEFRVPVDGRMRVWGSDDDGSTWSEAGTGWPDAVAFSGVLRDAMSVDGLDPCGVYIGTSSGRVLTSADRGETWDVLPFTFPRIGSVHAYTA